MCVCVCVCAYVYIKQGKTLKSRLHILLKKQSLFT